MTHYLFVNECKSTIVQENDRTFLTTFVYVWDYLRKIVNQISFLCINIWAALVLFFPHLEKINRISLIVNTVTIVSFHRLTNPRRCITKFGHIPGFRDAVTIVLHLSKCMKITVFLFTFNNTPLTNFTIPLNNNNIANRLNSWRWLQGIVGLKTLNQNFSIQHLKKLYKGVR